MKSNGIYMSYDSDYYLKTQKLLFTTDHDKIYFKSEDNKLCKLLGLIRNKIYEVNNTDKIYDVSDYKCFFNYCKTVNVECKSISKSTIYVKGEERYEIIKSSID